jgi:alkylation response protein AidB-like acyl-CoA dehydrogenase
MPYFSLFLQNPQDQAAGILRSHIEQSISRQTRARLPEITPVRHICVHDTDKKFWLRPAVGVVGPCHLSPLPAIISQRNRTLFQRVDNVQMMDNEAVEEVHLSMSATEPKKFRPEEARDGSESYRAEIRAWLESNYPARWRPERENYVAPQFDEQREWERRLHAAGWAGFTWPKAYGGQGLTMREHLIANDELGRVGIPDSVNGLGKDMIGPLILAIGSDAQRARFLPRILSMRDIWCQGFSEPEAGSDLASVRTTAVAADGGWRIEGQKVWTSFAQHADWCLILARTGDPARKHASLSLFTVPMDAPGITVRRIDQINGRANFCEVFFDNIHVPPDAVLGGVNEGWRAAGRVLEVERAINRMYRAGLFENELRHLVAACRSDSGLSATLDDPVYRQRIAGFYADIEVLRRLVRSTVNILAKGGEIGPVGSLIKLHWSESHQRLTALARDMLAHAARPLSAVVARAVARFNELYLRSRAETIQAGASAIQLGIISGRILGLPKA